MKITQTIFEDHWGGIEATNAVRGCACRWQNSLSLLHCMNQSALVPSHLEQHWGFPRRFSGKLVEPNPCVAQSLKKVGIPYSSEEMFRCRGTVSFNTAMNSLGGAGRVIFVCLLCWDVVPSMYNWVLYNLNIYIYIFGMSSYHIVSSYIIIRSEEKHALHLDKHQKCSGS